MKIVMFYHSLVSDWNHGNAHFLRGVVSELSLQGHEVQVYEPRDGWSLRNLRNDRGDNPLRDFFRIYPALHSNFYDIASLSLPKALENADLVLVHEWNDPRLVKSIGNYRRNHPHLRVLFHDTHHRSVTRPEEMERYDLADFDGVLAFGNVIRDIYLDRGWTGSAWTWHEAADTRVFRFTGKLGSRTSDLVWVGNWGDEERTAELNEFLIAPVTEMRIQANVYGVRYPAHGRETLANAGIQYQGWTPNFLVPHVFNKHRVTIHIPRRPYRTALPGIPTIRVFEALACGIPLVCVDWKDCEDLFRPGKDYRVARTKSEMKEHLRDLIHNPEQARDLAEHGRQTIEREHTCAHRVTQLLTIARELGIRDQGRILQNKAPGTPRSTGSALITSPSQRDQ